MVIDRLLFAAVAVALALYMAFDPSFAENLARAFGGEIPPLPFGACRREASGSSWVYS